MKEQGRGGATTEDGGKEDDMSCVRGLFLVGAVATAVLLFWPALVRAEEGAPSIEEMWAKIEVRLGALGRRKTPATKGAPAGAPEEKRAGPAKDKPAAAGKKTAAKRKSIDFSRLLKRLNDRAQEVFTACNRDNDEFGTALTHVRLEAFDKAAVILEQIMKQGSTAALDGRVEAEFAGAIVHLGRQDLALPCVPVSEKLLSQALLREDVDARPNRSSAKAIRSKHRFVKNYPESCKKLAGLTASLKGAPAAGKLWQVVKLYDADRGGVRLAVQWLKGIHEMRVQYPDHKVNQDGRSDQMLSRAYRHHAMYEECMAHVTQVLKDGPKTNAYIAKGHAHFDRARSQELLARHHRRMRQAKRALADYRKALELYREFLKELPDCSYTRPEEDGDPSEVERRIQAVREEIVDLGGTP